MPVVELHILQNFAPSCLNRDDTNSPKDCEFGGYRRARISSQCLKRAIRMYFREAGLLDAPNLAERSRRLVEEIATRAAGRAGKDDETARKLVSSALASVKLKSDDKGQTQYLLFLGQGEMDALADVVAQHWDELTLAAAPAPAPPASGGGQARKTPRQQKAEARDAVPPAVASKVEALLNGGKAADLALFGRMIADSPVKNIDGACQVAHAISTHKVAVEMDFYTAVDDLKEREEEAGAGMMGTVEFNSACFYRYANIDVGQLEDNLQDDAELARRTVRAFLRAAVESVPTGKQNSMAAHNPPALVFAVVRDRGLWSLANAFVQPVRPGHDEDLVRKSIQALDRYWGKLTDGYGSEGIAATPIFVLDEAGAAQKNRQLLTSLKGSQVPTVQALVDVVLAALPDGTEPQESHP